MQWQGLSVLSEVERAVCIPFDLDCASCAAGDRGRLAQQALPPCPPLARFVERERGIRDGCSGHLVVPYPRIERAVGEIHDEIEEHEQRRGQNDDDLNDGEIAVVNRLNKELFRGTVAMVAVNPYANELAMDFHTTLRYIERVADRSVKIAELVFYEVTGDRFSDKK